MSNDMEPKKTSIQAGPNGIHISDPKGYQAVIDPTGKVTFADFWGNTASIGYNSASVSYNIGDSSLSINSNNQVSLTTKIGPGEIKTTSQINPDGSISTTSISVTGATFEIGNKILSVEVGTKLNWTPENGLTYEVDGEITVLGQSITDIAELVYDAVEGSPVGQLMATRDEWMQAVINGETTDSHLEWLKKRNKNNIDPDTNNSFLDALRFIQRRDPLTLDLDGDGIETISANTGITFDFDGDGLKTGTGWVKGDDGFLVIDRNGNGTIDNGSELFGVDTIKSNGQKASDGFDALRDLDGNGDGIFDAQDAQFGNVRVWQDLNQDGVAQANELKTLAEHHITAVNLNSTASNQNSNGNIISATGSFIRDDGSEGAVNDNQSLAANLDLANNPFYREYLDALPISDAVAALPDMQGSGAVRDLREAATQNAELAQQLASYANAGTRAQQMAQLDSLLSAWAGSSGYRMLFERIDDMELGSGAFSPTIEFSYSWELPITSAIGSGHSNGGGTTNTGVSLEDGFGSFSPEPTQEQLEKKALLQRAAILEVFNGQNFFNFSTEQKEDSLGNFSNDIKLVVGTSTTTKKPPSGAGSAGLPSKIYITEEDLVINAGQEALLNQAYDALKESVYNGLLLQTRLKPYVNEISVSLGTDGITLDYAGVLNVLEQVSEANPVKAVTDLFDMQTHPKLKDTIPVDFATTSLLGWIEGLSTSERLSLMNEYGPTLLMGGDEAESLVGTSNDDRIYGGAGNDTIDGGGGANRLYGGSGDDVIKVDPSSSSNLLAGGTGNDMLYGSRYADTYLFNLGDGIDTIIETNGYTNTTDVLRFGEGITPEDIQTLRVGNDLVLAHTNGSDKVIIKGVFNQQSTADVNHSALIERLEFADGSTRTWSQITQAGIVQIGSDGDDTMIGYSGIDEIHGGAGNDTIDGGNSANRLYGGSGDDVIKVDPSSSSNLLAGGTGNDMLYGSRYADTYLFNLGDGIDTIIETNGYTNTTDVLRFGEGIAPEDIQTLRVGNDLVLAHTNGSDKVIIKGVFNQQSTADVNHSALIERLEFADGSTRTWSQITQAGIVQIGSDGDDTMIGYSGIDEIHGGAGNDTIDGGGGANRLYGGSGDDVIKVDPSSSSNLLAGGTGNDMLYGSRYADTYLFNLGDGIDTIIETNGYTNTTDVLRFGEGIAPEDIQTLRVGNDLVLAHTNGSDKVIIKGVFNQQSTADVNHSALIERLEFADGSTRTWSQITQAGIAQIGSDGDDTIIGSSGIDEIHGGAGNDTIDGGGGANRLYGGSGDDVIKVDPSSSSNLLAGGTGNDMLYGSRYADTYLFNLGDGIDTIIETNGYTNTTDVLRFGEGIAPEDIQTLRVGNDLVLAHTNGSDKVIIKGVFNQQSTADVNHSALIERLEFADGSTRTWSQITQAGIAQIGSDGDDTIIGSSGIDEIHGGAGNDTIDGGNSANRLYGGSGDDVIKVDPSSSSNLLAGGTGNDMLYGSRYADTYLFNLGDGIDTIIETNGYTNTTDVLRFGEGITPEDIQTLRVGNDLVLAHTNGSDKVIIKGVFNQQSTADVNHSALIERLEFADGSTRTWSQITQAGIVQIGSDGDDTMIGYSGIDEIHGGAGNDTIDGGNSANRLYGGSGDDVIKVDPSSSSNLLAGGTGNDMLYGSRYADTYLFNLGDGIDTITETNGYTNTTDVLRFGEGIAPEDIQTLRVGNDLVLAHTNGSDKVIIKGVFNQQSTADVNHSALIERLEFADGSTRTWSQITQAGIVQIGSDGDDTMIGYSGIDEIHGGAGNDTIDGGGGANRLYGGSGDDVIKVDPSSSSNLLAGGTGNDMLYGSRYADTYLFNLGDGIDTIIETNGYTNTTDVLRFGEGIEAGQIWLGREGNNLQLQLLGTDDQVSIKDWYSSTSSQIEEFQLNDGRALSSSQVNNLVNAMAAFGSPAGGELDLSSAQREQLDMVIAANWQ